MPFGAIRLIPGVNVERSATLNEAGYSSSQLIRWRDGLAQKLGGWTKFFPNALGGVPRAILAWEDLNLTTHLAVATTSELDVITAGSLQNITPQTLLSDFAPNFTTTAGSPTVTITDPNISAVTTLDSIYFNTPVSIDGIILSGVYPIATASGGSSYTIIAATAATAGVISGGTVPQFTTIASSALVTVTLANHGLVAGSSIFFTIPTSGNGITLSGNYLVTSAVAGSFTITANTQATANGSFSMNSGNAELLYYLNLGPPVPGAGFGIGGFGVGGFGVGVAPAAQTGPPLAATDWTLDNWGEVLLATPSGGAVYSFDPTGGSTNAGLVSSAPVYNGGLFVSTSQQILVCWGSTAGGGSGGQLGTSGIGTYRDPMLVRWSDSGNYFQFTPLSTNQAGSFRIPFGSELRAGLATQNQNFLWTDEDCWAMSYIQPPLVYSFNRIGAGAGAIGPLSVMAKAGSVYWMSQSNFYVYSGGVVSPLPCPVWDAVFQNINLSAGKKVRRMANTGFNEVGWLYPSLASTECDSYVKFNLAEQGQPWDIGQLSRSAWKDQNVYGAPISATPQGIVYQQESGQDADGAPLMASFTTGYSVIGDGEQLATVTWALPDMRWGLFGGAASASIQLTFNVINFPNDAPVSYGPYTVTAATEFLPLNFRGRQISVTVASSDLGSFWRLGLIRYRWTPSGRR